MKFAFFQWHIWKNEKTKWKQVDIQNQNETKNKQASPPKKSKPTKQNKMQRKTVEKQILMLSMWKQGFYQLYSRNIYRMSALESAKIWLVSHLKREAQNSGLLYLKANGHRNCKTTWNQGPVFWLLVITHVDLRNLPWYFAVPSTGVLFDLEIEIKPSW